MSGGAEATDPGFGDEASLTEPERMGAIVRLRDRYAGDELSLDEFSRALDGVLAAKTTQELSLASPQRELRAPASRVSSFGAEVLERHLAPGEQILWVGRPEANLNVTRGNAIGIVPVVAFGVFWMSGAVGSGVPVFFTLFGVMFFGAIIYEWMGRFFLRARRTLYAVTTRRIVRVVRRSSGEQTDSKLLQAVPNITVTEGKHNRGTVAFGEPAVQSRSRGNRGVDAQMAADAISFVNIAEPASVARLIGGLPAHQESRQ